MMNSGGEILDSVTTDLTIEICSRLPAKSVGKFRCVSKLWGSILDRPYFKELFLTRSCSRPRLLFILEGDRECIVFSSPQLQNPYGKSSLVVSADFHIKFSKDMWPAYCRGLIYSPNMQISQRKGEDEVPVIFNPRTRQYASLPKLTRYKEFYSLLGFDPIDNQFKVLSMAAYPHLDHKILTLRSGEMNWRKIQCPLTHDIDIGEICINGVLYYLVLIDENRSLMIACFDVRSEKFKFIKTENYYDKLINYKGKLGGIILDDANADESRTLELRLWILEDVEKQEWSKYVYTLAFGDYKFVDLRYVTVRGVTATGEIVLSMDYTSIPFYVFYFNPDKNTLQSVEIQGFGEYYDENLSAFVDYVEDLNFTDAKYLKSSQGLENS